MNEKIRITLHIPDELKRRLDKRPEVNWPEVIKQGIAKKLDGLMKARERGEL